jgi:large subunit ribosomal protein L6
MPVQIPDGVEINITDNIVSVKGSKGSLSQEISKDIKIDFIEKERQLNVSPATDDKELNSGYRL